MSVIISNCSYKLRLVPNKNLLTHVLQRANLITQSIYKYTFLFTPPRVCFSKHSLRLLPMDYLWSACIRILPVHRYVIWNGDLQIIQHSEQSRFRDKMATYIVGILYPLIVFLAVIKLHICRRLVWSFCNVVLPTFSLIQARRIRQFIFVIRNSHSDIFARSNYDDRENLYNSIELSNNTFYFYEDRP